MAMALLFNQSSTSGSDNVALPPTGVIRTVQHGAMATQVVKMDVGGETTEALVSSLLRMPVVNATGGNVVVAGQILLLAAGTAQQLPAYTTVNGVTVTANTSNLGVITVGGASVTNNTTGVGNGQRLQPGQSCVYKVSNTNTVWFNGTVTSDSIDFGGN